MRRNGPPEMLVGYSQIDTKIVCCFEEANDFLQSYQKMLSTISSFWCPLQTVSLHGVTEASIHCLNV